MVAAGLLNSLTTRSSVETIVHLQTEHWQRVLFHDQNTPEQLRLQFAEELARYQQVQQKQGTASAPPDLSTQLKTLGELRDQGVLSPEEFEVAKAKLLHQ